MKRRKCELIPVSEYDGTPPIAFEDNTHKYFKGNKGHYVKAVRKACSQCGKTALFVGIFKYKKHIRVERFKEHASQFGTLPDIPDQQEEQALPKWTNMKVII